jgi:RimJ/RimL family protein N-acetyltransferase
MPFDIERYGIAPLLARSLADMERGALIAFAVRRLADTAIVGSTSYLAITPEHARLEIGMTWYSPSAQATAVNAEAKYLLLENAFDCGYHRVEFKTDANNARSRGALRKLGAKEEGVLRGHMWVENGYFRDSVYYSILQSEWPKVKEALVNRLNSAMPQSSPTPQ